MFPMQAAGCVAFIHPKINEAFKNVLNEWARYLESPNSVHVLDTDKNGWLCQEALESMAKVASDGASKPKSFESYYICDPSKPHHGFTSWDNFFTRQFRQGRPPGCKSRGQLGDHQLLRVIAPPHSSQCCSSRHLLVEIPALLSGRHACSGSPCRQIHWWDNLSSLPQCTELSSLAQSC